MSNPVMDVSKPGCRGARAFLALSAVMLMGLHGSVRADTKQEPPAPPSAAAQAEPGPAPDESSNDAQPNLTPAEASTTPAASPVPPPPANAAPAPSGPPPGYGSPYQGPPPGYPYPPPDYPYPPPGYAYPPPGYPYGYGYRHHRHFDSPYEERTPGSHRRPHMLTFGVGLAALSGSSGVLGDAPAHRATEMGLSYALRLAFAANDKWFVVLALEGTTADFSDGFGEWHEVGTFSSTSLTVGAQYFINQRLYSRLGVGLGCLGWDNGYDDEVTCRGMAATGGIGFEFFQADSMSTALELAGNAISYTPDAGSGVWYSAGLNFVLSMF